MSKIAYNKRFKPHVCQFKLEQFHCNAMSSHLSRTKLSRQAVGKTEPSVPAEEWTEPSLPVQEKSEPSIPTVGTTKPSAPAEERTEPSLPTVERIVSDHLSPPAAKKPVKMPWHPQKELSSKPYGSPSVRSTWPKDRLTRLACTSHHKTSHHPLSLERERKSLPQGEVGLHATQQRRHASTLICPDHLDPVRTLTGWSIPRWPSGPL